MAELHITNWPQVWAAIDARRQQLGWSKTQLYERSGVSERTFVKMREGVPLKGDEKRIGLTRALQWTPNSLHRISHGEPPLIVYVPPGDPPEALPLRERDAELEAEFGVVGRELERLGADVVGSAPAARYLQLVEESKSLHREIDRLVPPKVTNGGVIGDPVAAPILPDVLRRLDDLESTLSSLGARVAGIEALRQSLDELQATFGQWRDATARRPGDEDPSEAVR